ncbi:hypothetical protein LEP1GSC199_3485 [Leptospira vanthielii serovar Holland str. Waz Holland = ATCC 700522]|uniref:Uncharacterized protein n=1 Tax=Leptospira vanthielii serovar Holland str. Waz Holland = ATCC 700522 TaxID=1218591 RepID=N1WDH8_9LEPT|nr:hypothetical protein LEP1GSC199_3485 [Leptospira vanthielii serovar Holland str. Waz Holland = ATCC 700522]
MIPEWIKNKGLSIGNYNKRMFTNNHLSKGSLDGREVS